MLSTAYATPHPAETPERANALGSLPVETTSSGILALAESGHVKAILEDQEFSLLRQP